MKQFCFWDEDDLSNLPLDFKLVPFNVAYIDPEANEKPKTSRVRKSPRVHKPSVPAAPGFCNHIAAD